MHYADYLPVRDRDFLSWTEKFLKVLPDFMEETGFPAEIYRQLAAQNEAFTQAYLKAVRPDTRTSLAVHAKNRLRDTLKKSVRQTVRSYLNYNPALSDANRERLGLAIHKATRTRIPVPDTHPEFSILPAGGSNLLVYFHESGKSSRHHNAKPFGVHGAHIAWAILPEPPASPDDLGHSLLSARSPYRFPFNLSYAGKRCYIALRWKNTRGEKGPWSEIKSAIIPG